MQIEQYQESKTNRKHLVASLAVAVGLAAVFSGCKGTAPGFSQAFGGLTAPARVPPPAQGSFQVPGSYSGGVGSSANPSASGLGGSSFGNGMKTSQSSQTANNLFNSISNAQGQVLSASNSFRDSVNRTAEDINSSVELASARVDRLNQGGAQAIAIFSEAATAPIATSTGTGQSSMNYSANESVPIAPSNSGRVGDSDQSDNANWRTPVRR